METPTPTSAAREANGPSEAANEFNAAFPPQFTILGVKLLPLSLGRYRLLKYAEVAFVAEGEASATMEDLIAGIAICGMRCDEFKELMASGKLERALKKWGQRLAKQIRREKGFNLFAKIALFNRYIQDGQKLPWVALPVQSGSTLPPDVSATHWSSSVEVVLRGQLNWTLAEIEEEPLTKALADYFKFMENEGHMRLIPHEQHAAMVQEGAENADALAKILAAQEVTA